MHIKKIIIPLLAISSINFSINAENYFIKLNNNNNKQQFLIQDTLNGNNSNNNGNTDNSQNPNSCKQIKDNDPSSTDGLYTLNLNSGEISVFCDMTTDGGGWTLISHIYDRNNRDDILNNSNGTAWGNPSVSSPQDDSSFNIAINDTPSYTESRYEWIFPTIGDTYSHLGNSYLVDSRFNWGSTNVTTEVAPLAPLGVNNVASDGRINGVFGGNSFSENGIYLLNVGHTCAGGLPHGNALHYWGYGIIIDFNGSTTNELHNIPSGNRSSGTGCGTRNSILNIWVR